MDYTDELPETLEAETPSFLVGIWSQGADFLTTYGWYVLGISLVVAYYWHNIQSWLDQRYKEQSEREYEAKCKKDPDLMHQRQLQMEAARKKMQEELNLKAALHLAKIKEKEEQKRAELLSSHNISGRKLNEKSNECEKSSVKPSSTKNLNRPEYNPLMGSGGSGGYRPPRRGCPGGGCG